MAAFSKQLEPPSEFPFPFQPYSIQTEFMTNLYRTLEEGKIGIFESPTGTGKSLSIICGCLKWLMDHQEKETRRVEAILSGDVSVLPAAPVDSSKDIHEQEKGSSTLSDWFSEYDQHKRLKDEVYRLKSLAERRRKREERIKQSKEQYGSSLYKRRTGDTNKATVLSSEGATTDTDSELILEEYHSDEEKNQSDSSESENEEDDDQGVKIFYASRTHSQLAQFVHEVQKTSYKEMVSVVPLGSRQTYCLNNNVTRLRSLSLMNDRCLELQRNKKKSASKTQNGSSLKQKRLKISDSNGCPFYKPTNMETLRDLALGEIQDIEQLVSLGREITGCPYYATRYAVPSAQLVVLPYNLLLHANTREAVGIKLKGNIVIIDEAHNLTDTISSIHSVHITLAHIKKTHSQLIQYHERYQSRLKAKNLMYIDQLLYILSSFQKLFQTYTHAAQTQTGTSSIDQDECELVRLNEFLLLTKTDNINMFKILQYCKKSEISKKLNGFVESYLMEVATESLIKADQATPISVQAVRHDKMEGEGFVPKSPLMLLEQFIESLTSTDKDCRIVIKRTGLANQSSLKFLLLNPSVQFASVVREARAVVLAGGTMKPFSDFKDQLFATAGIPSSRFLEFSCGHVIKQDHLLPLVLSKGSSGCQFDFTYQHRQDKHMIEELGRTIANLVTIVPGGVVCFFPSYEYEKTVYDIWDKGGLLERIGRKKQIFREPKLASQVESILSQYGRCIEFNTNTSTSSTVTGALMLCVVGGKLSEGINFSDSLGRCIIMIGLPYPNIKSPELKEKMDYLNSTQCKDTAGRSPGQLHYENLCMRAVNQSIGRAIRHANDYATIVLVDHRYANSSVHSKLPNWIASQLLITSSFGQGFSAIRKFFLTKKSLS